MNQKSTIKRSSKVGNTKHKTPDWPGRVMDMSRPFLKRDDKEEMRRKILDMTFSEWEKMGYSKGSLHYFKRNAKSDKPFKIYEKVKRKLV